MSKPVGKYNVFNKITRSGHFALTLAPGCQSRSLTACVPLPCATFAARRRAGDGWLGRHGSATP